MTGIRRGELGGEEVEGGEEVRGEEVGGEEMKEVFTISCAPLLTPQTFTGDGLVEPARPLRLQCNHLPIVMIAVREEMQDEMDAPFL